MKITARYSHLNGYEWLLVHEKKTWVEIEDAIKSIIQSNGFREEPRRR